ncbi:MAG: hypothetical protein R2822_13740 [Spirosomataceae bacterium]
MNKALAFIFLTVLGCKSENITTMGEQLGDEFNLKFSQKTQINNLKLSFDNVADSRCPTNVQCVRAGEVVVDLNVNTDQKVQLCLGDCQIVQPTRKKGFVVQDSLEVTVDSQKYLFILKQVNPYPVASAEAKEKYEVKMQINKL